MMDPLDMTGPGFLALYLSLLAGAVAMAALLRWVLRFPRGGAGAEAMGLDPYEVAHLTDAEELAADAAIAILAQGGMVTVNPAGKSINAVDSLPPGLHPPGASRRPGYRG